MSSVIEAVLHKSPVGARAITYVNSPNSRPSFRRGKSARCGKKKRQRDSRDEQGGGFFIIAADPRRFTGGRR